MHTQFSPLGEFDLIQRFFKTGADAMRSNNEKGIALGIGDDCALLKLDPGEEIAITSDMPVSYTHLTLPTILLV